MMKTTWWWKRFDNENDLMIKTIWWWKRLDDEKVVWSSSWVWTLFFNPIRPDEQDSKPSPRVRVRGLAQGSSSNECACSDSTRNSKTAAQSVNWTFDSNFDHTTSSSWTFERTKIVVRFNPSNKNSNPFNRPGQDRWTRLNPSGEKSISNPAQP
jgi:hypothetical protein